MSAEAPDNPPAILLSHYLKTLKLPTFQREHQKLARVPPPDPETPDCAYAASGIVSIWSRRNWAGERCPCRSISQFSL